ncbi:MAG: hypothetical protein ACE5IK_03905 [Acidobacteriota bacterium]
MIHRSAFVPGMVAAMVAVAFITPAPAAAAPASARRGHEVEKSLTVGEFVIELAGLIEPDLPGSITLEVAAEHLRRAGLDLAPDMDPGRPLTEGDIVRFSAAVGLQGVTTRHPDRRFPADKLDSLLAVLHPGLTDDELHGDDDDDGRDNNAGGSDRAREKRKKKKDFESPHVPPGQRDKG